MPETYAGRKKASSTKGAGKTDFHIPKIQTRSTSLAWYKTKFKRDQKSTIRPQTSKLSEEIISRIFQDLGIRVGFLNGYR